MCYVSLSLLLVSTGGCWRGGKHTGVRRAEANLGDGLNSGAESSSGGDCKHVAGEVRTSTSTLGTCRFCSFGYGWGRPHPSERLRSKWNRIETSGGKKSTSRLAYKARYDGYVLCSELQFQASTTSATDQRPGEITSRWAVRKTRSDYPVILIHSHHSHQEKKR